MFVSKLKQSNEALYNEAIRNLAEDGISGFNHKDLSDYDKLKLATLCMDDDEYLTQTNAIANITPILQKLNQSITQEEINSLKYKLVETLNDAAIEYYKDRIDRDLHDEYLNNIMLSEEYGDAWDEEKYADNLDRARAVNDVLRNYNY